MERGVRTIILAGGFGKRSGIQKPKLFIETTDGKNILDRMLQDLENVGITPIITTNGRFYPQISSYVKEKLKKHDISVLNNGKTSSQERLGALGDLLFAINASGLSELNDILVMPSDTAYWESFSIKDFLNFTQKHPNDFVTVVHDTGDREKIRKNLGCVIFGEDNEIIGFEEKPDEPKSTLTIVAIYLFKPEHLKLLRKFEKMGGNLNSPSNIIPYLMENGIKIFGFYPNGEIVDANNREEILKASKY